jgi:iron(III) transport system substrate-binding protein
MITARGFVSVFARLMLLFCVCMVAGPWLPVGHTAESWRSEWNKTVKAAEAEGQVSVYIAGYGKVIDSGEFQKAFPKIRAVSVTGSGTELSKRIAAERRAEKYLADVYNGGGNSLYQVLHLAKFLDPVKPALILPEVVDTSKWWEDKHKYVDNEGEYIFVYEGNVSGGGNPGYNTQQIDPSDFKSYWDFTNPKLKGKIVSVDPRKVRGAGASWQFVYYHPELGPKFIRRLYGEMDVTMVGDLRQAVDWIATGKFALCLPCQDSTVVKAKNQGLPVSNFPPYHFKEGINISSAFGQLALMNRAPHPNAAKVFINWYLSREGQVAFQKAISMPGDAKNSRRIDIPKDHIPAAEQRKDGLTYFDTDAPGSKDLRLLGKLLSEVMETKK